MNSNVSSSAAEFATPPLRLKPTSALVTASLARIGGTIDTMKRQAQAQATKSVEGVTVMPVRVVDGDTLDVRVLDSTLAADDSDGSGTVVRLRLQYIDAPEMHQQYGHEAKAKLDELVHRVSGPDERSLGADMHTTLQMWTNGLDRYGRQLALLYSHAVGDINAAMVRAGAAWVYRYKRDPHVPPAYYTYQSDAQDAKLGLWAGLPTMPQPPWEWRAQQRQERRARRAQALGYLTA